MNKYHCGNSKISAFGRPAVDSLPQRGDVRANHLRSLFRLSGVSRGVLLAILWVAQWLSDREWLESFLQAPPSKNS